MIKISTDEETGEPNGKFPPRFAFKINKYDNVHQCKVYDSNRKLFNIDNPDKDDYKSLSEDVLVKGASMSVGLKCNGIWIANGKFGCTWKAEQIRVKLPEGGLRDFAILSKLSPWDHLPGILIAREAGAVDMYFDQGKYNFLSQKQNLIVASNKILNNKILNLIKGEK